MAVSSIRNRSDLALVVVFLAVEARRAAGFRAVEALEFVAPLPAFRAAVFRVVPDFRAVDAFPAVLLRAVLFLADPLCDAFLTLERLVRLDCGIEHHSIKIVWPLR